MVTWVSRGSLGILRLYVQPSQDRKIAAGPLDISLLQDSSIDAIPDAIQRSHAVFSQLCDGARLIVTCGMCLVKRSDTNYECQS
jgi:hypothetical protein